MEFRVHFRTNTCMGLSIESIANQHFEKENYIYDKTLIYIYIYACFFLQPTRTCDSRDK